MFYLSPALTGQRTLVVYPSSQLTIPPSKPTVGPTCKRVVDVGLKRDYAWTFIVAHIKQPILGMRTGLAIHATLSSIKPLSLCIRNEYHGFHRNGMTVFANFI